MYFDILIDSINPTVYLFLRFIEIGQEMVELSDVKNSMVLVIVMDYT